MVPSTFRILSCQRDLVETQTSAREVARHAARKTPQLWALTQSLPQAIIAHGLRVLLSRNDRYFTRL